jgi:hypothetical protein
MDTWSSPNKLGLTGPKGEVHFRDPFVTADGLMLYLGHSDGEGWRVFRATRSSRGASWSTPQELPGFRSPSWAVPYPSAFSDPDEVVAAIAGTHTDMGAIVPKGGEWSAIKYPELWRSDIELAPTVTADGTTLVYFSTNAPRPNEQFRALVQSTRGAPSRTSPWSGPRNVDGSPDGGSALPQGLKWPALTSDGLGLFYSTEAAPHRVQFVARKVRTASFFGGAPLVIADLSATDGLGSRVRSMTADGCEVYLTSDRDGVEEAWFATRK